MAITSVNQTGSQESIVLEARTSVSDRSSAILLVPQNRPEGVSDIQPLLIAQASEGAPSKETYIDVMIKRLGDADWKVRAAAIEEAVNIGDAAVSPLIEALSDDNVLRSECSGKALVKMGKVSITKLIQKLGDIPKPQDFLQEEPVVSKINDMIYAMNRETVRNAMLEALKSKNALLRERAIEIILSHRWEVFDKIVTSQAMNASDMEFIVSLLKDESSFVRLTVASDLAAIFDEKYLMPSGSSYADISVPGLKSFKFKSAVVEGQSMAAFIAKRFLEEKDPEIKTKLAQALRAVAWVYSAKESDAFAQSTKDKRWALLALIRSSNFKNFGFITWDERASLVRSGYYTRTIPARIVNDPILRRNAWVMDSLDATSRKLIADQLCRVDVAGAIGGNTISTAALASAIECEYTIAVKLGDKISLGVETYISRLDSLSGMIGLDDWAGGYSQKDLNRLLNSVKVPKEVKAQIEENKKAK